MSNIFANKELFIFLLLGQKNDPPKFFFSQIFPEGF